MKTLSPENITRELEQAQNRVLDLRQVKYNERHYKAAQAEIEQISRSPHWQESQLIAVRNIADHPITGIHEATRLPENISSGMTGTVYKCQLRALRKFLEPLDPEPEAKPEAAARPFNQTDLPSTIKLKELLAQIEKIDKDAAELERMASAARVDMTLIAASNMPLEQAKKKISEANMTLDFVAARNGKIKTPASLILAQLSEELHRQVDQWNNLVAGQRLEMEEKVIQANTDFFNGNERACRSMFDSGIMTVLPVFAIFRAAIYDDLGLRKLEGLQLVARTKNFMSHVGRHCAALNISPETAV